MKYTFEMDSKAQRDVDNHIHCGRKNLAAKVYSFIPELETHPRTGTGQPEQLRHQMNKEIWSRRIDAKHRLVYEIQDDRLIVIAVSAAGHYGDK